MKHLVLGAEDALRHDAAHCLPRFNLSYAAADVTCTQTSQTLRAHLQDCSLQICCGLLLSCCHTMSARRDCGILGIWYSRRWTQMHTIAHGWQCLGGALRRQP